MGLFDKKKQEKKEEPKGDVVGFTKQKRFLFFKIKSKPIYGAPGAQPQGQMAQQAPQPQPQPQERQTSQMQRQQQAQQPKPQTQAPQFKPLGFLRSQPAQKTQVQQQRAQPTRGTASGIGQPMKKTGPGELQLYFMSVAARHKDLEPALRAQGIKASPYDFIRRMFVYSLAVSMVITLAVGALLLVLGVTVLFAVLLGVASFYALFNRFISYPIDRSVVVGKEIEKNILFAARDLVISMRSGMPLFNAITAVSTGYGAASSEFARVVELVQLGTPIEQALDEVSARSQSRTFKRIMLQTTVSLKAGADVVGALQGVVEEVSQERVIELRRYGQRLNALAMFYMLFGIIFPSMGIAVAAILSTFINIFSIDQTSLLFALVVMFFIQIVFLNIMRSSRPTFAM